MRYINLRIYLLTYNDEVTILQGRICGPRSWISTITNQHHHLHYIDVHADHYIRCQLQGLLLRLHALHLTSFVNLITLLIYICRVSELAFSAKCRRRRFWHASLRLRSTMHWHHPPQRAVLSQICCFGEHKLVLQILLDGAEPRDAGTTQLSSPVCRRGPTGSSWHLCCRPCA